MALILRCTSAWEMHLRCQGWGGLQRLWPPAGGAVVLPEIGAVWRELGGDTGSSGSGAERPAPPSAGASIEEPPTPRVSAASLRTLLLLCMRPSLLWFSFFISDCLPKIGNLRNHREADTDANTRGFIYKLELVSQHTRHSGAGTWNVRWVVAEF